ncbi:2017_t:CDS:1, partial [Cetraspora pellucida]
CNDWPAIEKTKYIQKIKEESLILRKHTNDNVNDEKDEKGDSFTEPTTHDDGDNAQQPPAPRQNTILSWCTHPLPHEESKKLHKKLLKSIIHGNVSFNFVDNSYFQDFLRNLNPSYNPPTRNVVKERLLTEMFSDHLQKKLNTLPTLTDITISLNGWTDNSGNSVYRFMVLKENQEMVIDVIDLSTYCHTGDFLKDKLKEVLTANGIKMPSIITCVTDNLSNMGKM